MSELTVFLAAWLGAITGVLTTAIPLVLIAKQKLSDLNPLKMMGGDMFDE